MPGARDGDVISECRGACDRVPVKPGDGDSSVAPDVDSAESPVDSRALRVCNLCGWRVVQALGWDADELLRDHAQTCTSELLLSRLEGLRALEKAIGASPDRSCGVLFIDIDHFHVFNNTYGHRAGDVALFEFATRLVEAAAGDAELARIGGQQFLVVLPNAALDAACAVAERICERTRSEPFEPPNGGASTITTSIGVACAPMHGATWDAVLGAADRAMYECKRNGRDQWTLATY
jgi:two-component system cell cycle response regulator